MFVSVQNVYLCDSDKTLLLTQTCNEIRLWIHSDGCEWDKFRFRKEQKQQFTNTG